MLVTPMEETGGLQHNKGKNKQVSKVIVEISENETNVLIMRVAG